MKRECAWCHCDLGTTRHDAETDPVVTHGICPPCANKLLGSLGIELNRFLDTLGVPVLLVDEAGCIRTANSQARALLRKDLSGIEGYRGGDVFECIHAQLPGGCGHTTCCSGCTIRKTVMDTWQSGRSHLKTPAYLTAASPPGNRKIDLLISTEKTGNTVFLRIDRMESRDLATSSAVPNT